MFCITISTSKRLTDLEWLNFLTITVDAPGYSMMQRQPLQRAVRMLISHATQPSEITFFTTKSYRIHFKNGNCVHRFVSPDSKSRLLCYLSASAVNWPEGTTSFLLYNTQSKPVSVANLKVHFTPF